MTQIEMENLKAGDIVVDLESTVKWERTVICEVLEVEDGAVVLDALKEKDKGGYPHRFRCEHESSKLGKITIEEIQP
jgi:hypothetical protein